jgi:hypothetical protein
MRTILYTVVIALMIGFTGCGGRSKEIQKDAKTFADAMCRSIDVMRQTRAANPADSALIKKLQQDQMNIKAEMMQLHADFKKKYGNEAEAPDFNKQYRKYLSDAMLECKFLSKEDRALFEKQLE